MLLLISLEDVRYRDAIDSNLQVSRRLCSRQEGIGARNLSLESPFTLIILITAVPFPFGRVDDTLAESFPVFERSSGIGTKLR